MPEPTRKPRGEYRPKTEAELDALAAFSESDIDEAVAQFDADASPGMKGLLDAQLEQEGT